MTGDPRVDRLRARLDEHLPEAWIPSAAGDEIVGVYVGLEGPVFDRFRGEVFVAIVEVPATEEGSARRRVALRLHHAALANEMKRKRPEVGDLLAIRYLGKQAPKGGGPEYDNYRVEVDRATSTGSEWDRLPGDDEPPATPAAEESTIGPSELCFECHEQPPAHAPWCSIGNRS